MRKDFFDDERELIFPTDSERVWQLANPFQGYKFYYCLPMVVASLQPWAAISEHLRRLVTLY
jgi:hypothetical protein